MRKLQKQFTIFQFQQQIIKNAFQEFNLLKDGKVSDIILLCRHRTIVVSNIFFIRILQFIIFIQSKDLIYQLRMQKKSYFSQQIEEEATIIKQQNPSLYQQYYFNHLTPLSRNSEEFKYYLHKLKENKFEYSKEFSFQFKKAVVKNSRDSVEYQIQYGNFKTFINVVFLPYKFQGIKRVEIDQGYFGKIFSFKYQQYKIVAKSISLDNSSTDSVLEEIFWAKFASILGIGPSFLKAYGYDVIFFNNSFEYLMEYCSNEIKQQIANGLDEQKIFCHLKTILQILHSFNAIHGDIKVSHIAWSSDNKKFVFIDFGMTKFVKEQIGEMTKTEFFGTYCYSCIQMKKAYTLKSPVFVDLFYNDLYGLEQSRKFIIKKSFVAPTRSFLRIQSRWELVVSLINFKFQIFGQNLSEASKICKASKQLGRCFRHIINFEKQMSFSTFTINLWDQLKQYFEKNNFLSDVGNQNNSPDQTIYLDLLKYSNKPLFCNSLISESFIKRIHQNKTLADFLSKGENMGALFEFLFEQKKLSQKQIIQKQKIIEYIFLTKNSFKSETPKMVRWTLLMFQDYFYKAGNLDKLYIMSCFFWIVRQIKQLQSLQHNICEVFLKNPDSWLDLYKQEIVALFNLNINSRLSWYWHTTKPSIQEQFLREKNKLIEACTFIIIQMDRITAQANLNINYDKQKYEKIKKLYAQVFFTQPEKIQFDKKYNQKNQSYKITHYHWLEQKEQTLRRGILTWKQEKAYQKLLSALPFVDYYLRDTVWSLVSYLKANNLSMFENCLQQIADYVFLTDSCEGVNNFLLFSVLFVQAIQISIKTQQFLINFLKNIQITQILHQNKDNAISLCEFFLNFFFLTKLFLQLQLDQKQTLCKFYRQIKFFVDDNLDQWWTTHQSIIMIALELTNLYLSPKTNNDKIQFINKKLLTLIKNIIPGKYSFDIFDCIFTIISQNIKQLNNADLILDIFNLFKDRGQLYGLLSKYIELYEQIIRILCYNDQFIYCLGILEEYGKLAADNEALYCNLSYNHCFYLFVELLPDSVATDLFTSKLQTFQLKRIVASYRLSFIFLFILMNKQYLLTFDQKMRYYKIIIFGLSKIKIKYHKYSQINGYLFYFYRSHTHLKNSRKYRLHLKKQFYASHSLITYKKLTNKRLKKYLRIKISDNKEIVKRYMMQKIQRNIDIQ